ncbi:MAG: efflux RND transporter periplasmic adaptor subunit [Myxococcales bacterium]|nr:efflux RND transporter periplasmic adaptor subunit [Myxococcales bacterium]
MKNALQVLAVLVAFGLGVLVATPRTSAPVTSAPETVWTCSMHPQIRQGTPGTCPICGMDLVPAGSLASASTERVVLSERARALARLRTTPVHRQGDAAAELRLLGRVDTDETTRSAVTSWIGGRIERLHVAATGAEIGRGQVVATLFSPEIYAAHQDLLTTREQVGRLPEGPARNAARATLDAARQRLALLGVPERELADLEAASAPARTIPIRSPYAGTVIERVATEGTYVQTGSPLYRLADLGHLWVQLDAYESDLPRLAVGQPVELTAEGAPDRTFAGRVTFVDPTVDVQRRTARVRVEVDQPEGLRPGMFAEATVLAPVAVDGETRSPLVIPDTAPLFTGKRSLVYVEEEGPDGLAYAPRVVRLGPRLGDVYPVVAGLSEGERVVSRGAFALDADLQIKGGPSMMSLTDDAGPGPWDEVVQLQPADRARLAPVLEAYLGVQRALAADDHASTVEVAAELGTALGAAELPGDQAPRWAELADRLRTDAAAIARSADLEGARGPFEPLSEGMKSLLRRYGNPLDAPIQVAFCPMAHDNEGASWVQQGERIDNAYFGAAMRTCGEVKDELQPGAWLPGASAAAPAHAGHDH